MRILVISDLHANWPALEAVLATESHDCLLVIGDLVSYGLTAILRTGAA